MTARRKPSSDPTIKVTVFMPASVFMRLQAHADLTGSNMSRICREAALLALPAADPDPPR